MDFKMFNEIDLNIRQNEPNNVAEVTASIDPDNKENSFIVISDDSSDAKSSPAKMTQQIASNENDQVGHTRPRHSILKEFDPLFKSPIRRLSYGRSRELDLEDSQRLNATQQTDLNDSITEKNSVQEILPHTVNCLETEPVWVCKEELTDNEDSQKLIRTQENLPLGVYSQEIQPNWTYKEQQSIEECLPDNDNALDDEKPVVALNSEFDLQGLGTSGIKEENIFDGIKLEEDYPQSLKVEELHIKDEYTLDGTFIEIKREEDPQPTETAIILDASDIKEESTFEETVEVESEEKNPLFVNHINNLSVEEADTSAIKQEPTFDETLLEIKPKEEYPQSVEPIEIFASDITQENLCQETLVEIKPENENISAESPENIQANNDSQPVEIARELKVEFENETPVALVNCEFENQFTNTSSLLDTSCIKTEYIPEDTPPIIKSESDVPLHDEKPVILLDCELKQESIKTEPDSDSKPGSGKKEDFAKFADYIFAKFQAVTSSELENKSQSVNKEGSSPIVENESDKCSPTLSSVTPDKGTDSSESSQIHHDNSVSEISLELPENSVQQINSDNCSRLVKRLRKPGSVLSCDIECQTVDEFVTGDTILRLKMVDMCDQIHELQKEISELKLKLNAAQQAKASLELEIRQKEEVIIKTQAEAINTEQNYKIEIKHLKEKLKENSEIIDKDPTKILEQQLQETKERESKTLAELNQKNMEIMNYQKILESYEQTMASRLQEYQKLHEEHEITKRHFANLELAFSDVHSKYEKTKELLIGMKQNEEALQNTLQAAHQINSTQDGRYESLKSHAQAQIEKSNREIILLQQQHEEDTSKLKALVKRFEIKCKSLEVALNQKEDECKQLSALCDEVTGKRL